MPATDRSAIQAHAVALRSGYTRPHVNLPDLSVSFHPLIEIRAAWRLMRLGVHLLGGLLEMRICGARMDAAQRAQFKQRWAIKVLKILAVKLRVPAGDLPARSLIVSNHVSLLDVFVITAMTQAHFVCKDDVRKWPGVGWLIAVTGTIFISRNSRADAARTARTLTDTLLGNERVAFFPEGTTTNGTLLLPFSAALFEPASKAQACVIPMAVRYLDLQERVSLAPAYDGDITFMECLLAIVRARGIIAELQVLPAIPTGLDRREYAAISHEKISRALGYTQS